VLPAGGGTQNYKITKNKYMTTIKLTYEEHNELYQLVRESSDTGNEEWDEKMKNILKKMRNAAELGDDSDE
jgi:hypothetical protein